MEDVNRLQEARDKVAANPLVQALQEEGPDDVKDALKTIMEAKIVKLNELEELANEAGGEVKGVVDLNLKDAVSLTQAIHLAVGAASMCWENVEAAGIFDSDRAHDIATQLEHDVRRRINTRTLVR